jgi:hypothetical protein
MPVDDLIDVLAINIGVPNPLGVNDQHRPLRTAVEAAGFINSHLPHTVDSQLFATVLGIALQILCAVTGTTGLTVRALVEAEKDVALKIRGVAHVTRLKVWIRDEVQI